MPIHPNLTSRCCKPSAERDSLTFRPPFPAAGRGEWEEINKRSTAFLQIYRFVEEITVDGLVFEFMGLAMLGLCVIVLAVPSSQRPRGRQIRDY
jgi:hypothetical protein